MFSNWIHIIIAIYLRLHCCPKWCLMKEDNPPMITIELFMLHNIFIIVGLWQWYYVRGIFTGGAVNPMKSESWCWTSPVHTRTTCRSVYVMTPRIGDVCNAIVVELTPAEDGENPDGIEMERQRYGRQNKVRGLSQIWSWMSRDRISSDVVKMSYCRLETTRLL